MPAVLAVEERMLGSERLVQACRASVSGGLWGGAFWAYRLRGEDACLAGVTALAALQAGGYRRQGHWHSAARRLAWAGDGCRLDGLIWRRGQRSTAKNAPFFARRLENTRRHWQPARGGREARGVHLSGAHHPSGAPVARKMVLWRSHLLDGVLDASHTLALFSC